MKRTETIVKRYEESRRDDGTIEEVYVRARVLFEDSNESEFTMRAVAQADGELEVRTFNDENDTLFRRRSFPVFWDLVDELKARSLNPDTGCLSRGGTAVPDGTVNFHEGGMVEMSVPPLATYSSLEPRPIADGTRPAVTRHNGDPLGFELRQESDTEGTNEVEGSDSSAGGVWCGRCGEGPFDSLGIHNGLRHDNDPIPLDEKPSSDELTSESSADEENVGQNVPDSDELECPDPDCEQTFDGGQALSGHLNNPHTPCSAPVEDEPEPKNEDEVESDDEHEWPSPYEIIDRSQLPARIDLPDVLQAVEKNGSIVDVSQTLNVAVGDIKNVLWELELRKQGKLALVDEDDLQNRLSEIRAEVAQ